MAIVSADGFNPEGKLFNDMVNKINGTGLRVSIIDFEGSDTGTIINGRVLITLSGVGKGYFQGKMECFEGLTTHTSRTPQGSGYPSR